MHGFALYFSVNRLVAGSNPARGATFIHQPPVRVVPATAGALGMPPRRFYPYNLAAIALWAPAHVVPGLLAGTAYRHAGTIA